MSTTYASAPTSDTTTAPPAPASRPTSISFGTLLGVELRKATDTRAARSLLALTALATVGAVLAPLLAPHSIDQTVSSYVGFASLAATVLLPVVAIMLMTGEWSQRTALSTFTQEPRRGRVTAAKLATSLIIAVGAMALAAASSAAAIAVATVGGRHVTGDFGVADLTGNVLFFLLTMLMGAAFGALLHNTPSAIVSYFALPTVFTLVGQATHVVRDWFDPTQALDHISKAQWSGHVGQIAVALGVWILVPLVVGLRRTLTREVS